MATRSVTAQPRSDLKDHAEIDAIFPRSTHLPGRREKGKRAGLGRPTQSRDLAGFSCRLSRDPWLFPSCCGSFPPFGCRFNWRWQFQFGLFRRAMVAMAQRLDPRSFCFDPHLIVFAFLALVL